MSCRKPRPTIFEHTSPPPSRDGAHLLITPHAAFYSDDAFVEMRHLAAREAGRVLRGEPAWYKVN